MEPLTTSTPPVTLLVLTHNEAAHIERCLESARGAVSRVVVVDSGSTDATLEIAKRCGAEVYSNAWTNHAVQINWALDNCSISSSWVFRLDADEFLTPELRDWLQAKLASVHASVDGLTVRRRLHFQGQWIRHGGIYPRHILRLWRANAGRCEQRWMDEHIVVSGRVDGIPHDIVDDNTNPLAWWIAKHNSYSSREAAEILLQGNGADNSDQGPLKAGAQARRVRFLKNRVYGRLPPGLRALAYFIARYFFMLGFLDGRRGTAFHFLQALWYRYLVDLKINEVKRAVTQGTPLVMAIEKLLGVPLVHGQQLPR